jgi:hypothetical protein
VGVWVPETWPSALSCRFARGGSGRDDRSVLAGDHRGPDAILGFFGKTFELTAGTFRVEVHDVVADDRHTVGLHLATGRACGPDP